MCVCLWLENWHIHLCTDYQVYQVHGCPKKKGITVPHVFTCVWLENWHKHTPQKCKGINYRNICIVSSGDLPLIYRQGVNGHTLYSTVGLRSATPTGNIPEAPELGTPRYNGQNVVSSTDPPRQRPVREFSNGAWSRRVWGRD